MLRGRESLLEDDVPVLRNRLIGWLVKLVNEGLPKLIAKKTLLYAGSVLHTIPRIMDRLHQTSAVLPRGWPCEGVCGLSSIGRSPAVSQS